MSFLFRIICKCAQLAKERNFKFIMVRFYGECWGSNDYEYSHDTSPDDDCIDDKYQPCGEKEICMGKNDEAFVYRVLTPQE